MEKRRRLAEQGDAYDARFRLDRGYYRGVLGCLRERARADGRTVVDHVVLPALDRPLLEHPIARRDAQQGRPARRLDEPRWQYRRSSCTARGRPDSAVDGIVLPCTDCFYRVRYRSVSLLDVHQLREEDSGLRCLRGRRMGAVAGPAMQGRPG